MQQKQQQQQLQTAALDGEMDEIGPCALFPS